MVCFHKNGFEIIHKLHDLELGGKSVEFCWVPSHVGIFGNECADKLASDAAKQQESLIPIDYNDFFNHLSFNMNQVRSHKWQQSNQHLREIKDNINYWSPMCKNRREEVVINRLRLGHCWFSHHHLMITDGPRIPTICSFCSLEPMTVKHIFVESPSLRQRRAGYLSCCNNSNYFSLIDILGADLVISEVLTFISNIHLLNYV